MNSEETLGNNAIYASGERKPGADRRILRSKGTVASVVGSKAW